MTWHYAFMFCAVTGAFLWVSDWHLHKWQVIDQWEINEMVCGIRAGGHIRYYCRCEICGKHKKFD